MLLAIAVALAMDAFAVSLAIALSLKTPSSGQVFRLAFNFGLFQFLMPVAGWLAGRGLHTYIEGFDHWVAFGLLAFIGGKMILGACPSNGSRRVSSAADGDPTRGVSLVILSVATSIDALAVGLSLSLLGVEIIFPALVIGIVAFLLTAAGMRLGPLAGRIFGKRMEVAGGVILIAIGLNILFGHLLK